MVMMMMMMMMMMVIVMMVTVTMVTMVTVMDTLFFKSCTNFCKLGLDAGFGLLP